MRRIAAAAPVRCGLLALAVGTLPTSVAQAGAILSTSTQAELGGLAFEEGELVDHDPGSDTSTLLLDGTLFSLGENIDAVHLLPNGNVLLSTQNGATLGGLTFGNGDVLEYDFATDTATLFFSAALFSGSRGRQRGLPVAQREPRPLDHDGGRPGRAELRSRRPRRVRPAHRHRHALLRREQLLARRGHRRGAPPRPSRCSVSASHCSPPAAARSAAPAAADQRGTRR